MIDWSDIIFAMEQIHVERIRENTGDPYVVKIVCLEFEDKYKYIYVRLIEKLKVKIED
jgi:predicted protein tyrosine phosphatase